MTFKKFLIQSGQTILGFVLMAATIFLTGLIVKTTINLFMYGYRLW